MKRIAIVITMITMLKGTEAQTLSPFVIASSGGYYSQGGYSLSETVAEMAAVSTLTDAGNILTQGFQQPDVLPNGVAEIIDGEWQIKVYPNPTADKVSITASTDGRTMAKVTLVNMMGQVMLENMEIDLRDPFQIDLSSYVSGVYLVNIDADGRQKTFHINKID